MQIKRTIIIGKQNGLNKHLSHSSLFFEKIKTYIKVTITWLFFFFNYICLWYRVFNYNCFNHKNLFRQIWNIVFCKDFFWFYILFDTFDIWYFIINNISNSTFRIFIINFLTRVHIRIWFFIKRLHFDCDMIFIVVFVHYVI